MLSLYHAASAVGSLMNPARKTVAMTAVFIPRILHVSYMSELLDDAFRIGISRRQTAA